MRSLIDVPDLSVDELYGLIDRALDIIARPSDYSRSCSTKKLATLFFEPSTRTRLSFEAAMYELGGSVLSVSSASSSSASKGESVSDTARTVSCYADIIAIRHPVAGAALAAARSARVPVINAGDGGHCHPTQTLADLLTIFREKGGFEDLCVGVCGDLLYGRTVHSLIRALSRYEGVKFVAVSPRELRLPGYMPGCAEITETDSLEDAMPSLDVLYMTRIQRERFDDPDEYARLKDSYILTSDKMRLAKSDCIVMHPLPRVNEISTAVDDDPRACYFKQVENGKYMRMALILKLLEESAADGKNTTRDLYVPGKRRCTNPRCITAAEPELTGLFKTEDGTEYCAYCDSEII